MASDNAVATVDVIRHLNVLCLVIFNAFPYECATSGCVKFMCDLVVNNEMQIENAVATMDGLQGERFIVGSGMVVDEAEAMVVIQCWHPMPAAAVGDGRVVRAICCDINKQTIGAIGIGWVVLKAAQDSVVGDQDIVETMARVILAHTEGLVFVSGVFLSDVDVEFRRVAFRSRAPAFIGGD